MTENVTHLALIKTAKSEAETNEWLTDCKQSLDRILENLTTKEYKTVVVVALTADGMLDVDLFGDEPMSVYALSGMLDAAKMDLLAGPDETDE